MKAIIVRPWLHLFACAIALAGCGEKKPEDPRLDVGAGGFTLYLPPKMQQALDAASPGFHKVMAAKYRADINEAATEEGGGAQALNAVIGDFDLDGSQDVVVEGTNAAGTLVVIAILNGATPKAVEVASFATFDADAVGIYLSRIVRPKLGAFEVVNYPDETTLYFYRGGTFEGMKTNG